MPLPNTRVIRPDWSAHHRPVVAGSWTGTCTIRHPGGTRGDFDDSTGTYPIAPFDPYYDGGCRIQALSTQERSELFAEEPVSTHSYRVVIDLASSAEVAIGDLVVITGLEPATDLYPDATLTPGVGVDDNGDPDLIDRPLTVQAYTRGTLMWERDLICVENQDHAEGA